MSCRVHFNLQERVKGRDRDGRYSSEKKLDIFIELFGVSFPGFILILVGVIVLIVLLIIPAKEYGIYKRKKIPTPFRPSE